MKKSLLGVANNLRSNLQKVTLWSKSFKQVTDGEVILLLANGTEDDLLVCKELGITSHLVTIEDEWFFNHKRLEHTLEFLKETDIDLFMITDVFDVVFQGDPFELMDLDNYDVFAGGEGVDINQEPWNMDNIGKIFPQYRDGCVGKEIVNSGVIGGKRESLISVYERMFTLCEEGSNDHNIKDQAAFNVMISRSEVPRFKLFNLDEGWVQHSAVSGPTEFFDKWGFRNNLKYGIPQMIDNTVCTSTGVPFRIAHQFNRVPDWHHKINSKYEIEFEKDVHR
jgi:hypothetical protein